MPDDAPGDGIRGGRVTIPLALRSDRAHSGIMRDTIPLAPLVPAEWREFVRMAAEGMPMDEGREYRPTAETMPCAALEE